MGLSLGSLPARDHTLLGFPVKTQWQQARLSEAAHLTFQNKVTVRLPFSDLTFLQRAGALEGAEINHEKCSRVKTGM
jgi:hypothetical protein